MIIVSQDKMKILNFEQLQEIEINTPEDWNQGFYSIDTYPLGEGNKAHIRLGIYKTEERAKEILQKIIEFYEISKRNECSSNNGMPLLIKTTFVYEMTKE